MDCLFCKIAHGSIPANIIYEDTEVLAFHDVAPQAPTHILIIPKEHIETINNTNDTHQLLLGKLIITAKKLAENLGLSEPGYRLIFNVNKHGGQSVYHIHMHLLGGRQLTWPPG
ncbi:MAG: histidine triad nucleotide-binding protein [Legionellaceae bacterium]|nr:histidine triad nucleotide-binding protein [Legionellaceae bacterium]